MRQNIAPIQMAAIKRARRIARDYVDDYGEDIAERYRQGHQQNEIASDYMNIFPTTSLRIARTAVAFIIRELIPARERRSLAKKHRKAALTALGKDNYEKGKACFSLTEKERYNVSSDVGKNLRDEGKGIFAISEERRKRIAKKAGRETYRKKSGIFALTMEDRMEAIRGGLSEAGFNVWQAEETEYLLQLLSNPGYTHHNPPYSGKPDLAEIANELNRTKSSVSSKLSKLRKTSLVGKL